jgi:hypothetical protein
MNYSKNSLDKDKETLGTAKLRLELDPKDVLWARAESNHRLYVFSSKIQNGLSVSKDVDNYSKVYFLSDLTSVIAQEVGGELAFWEIDINHDRFLEVLKYKKKAEWFLMATVNYLPVTFKLNILDLSSFCGRLSSSDAVIYFGKNNSVDLLDKVSSNEWIVSIGHDEKIDPIKPHLNYFIEGHTSTVPSFVTPNQLQDPALLGPSLLTLNKALPFEKWFYSPTKCFDLVYHPILDTIEFLHFLGFESIKLMGKSSDFKVNEALLFLEPFKKKKRPLIYFENVNENEILLKFAPLKRKNLTTSSDIVSCLKPILFDEIKIKKWKHFLKSKNNFVEHKLFTPLWEKWGLLFRSSLKSEEDEFSLEERLVIQEVTYFDQKFESMINQID